MKKKQQTSASKTKLAPKTSNASKHVNATQLAMASVMVTESAMETKPRHANTIANKNAHKKVTLPPSTVNAIIIDVDGKRQSIAKTSTIFFS